MKLIIILFSSVLVNCAVGTEKTGTVDVTVPIPALTNAFLSLSSVRQFRVKPVLTGCIDMAKYIPSQDVVKMVAKSDVYLSLGIPFEHDLCKRALQINNSLKVFQVTNGCKTIGGNMYVWLSPDNMEIIGNNVKRCLAPNDKSFSWSCMSLKDCYKNLGLTVALAHPAFEYPCNYFGLRYVRLYDADGNLKRGSIESVIRESKASYAFALEHQTSEMDLLASKGFDVGSVDIGDAEALVQFAKCIRKAIAKEEDKMLKEAEKESERRNGRLDAPGGPHGH